LQACNTSNLLNIHNNVYCNHWVDNAGKGTLRSTHWRVSPTQ